MEAEQKLIERIKNGEKSVFAVFVQRYQISLLHLCQRYLKRRDLAEEVVQEAFVKAYLKISTFQGRSTFKSWLFQIAINTAKNKLRRRRLEKVEIDHVGLAMESEVIHGLVHESLQTLLETEIEKLPPRQKMALQLRIYDDMSFHEIAVIMECPYDTAKANYRHALVKLKKTFLNDHTLKDWGNFLEERPQMIKSFSSSMEH